MRYRNPKVAIGITLGGFFPNCLYHFVNADFIGSAEYHSNYYYDPRFIVGIILFCAGYVINRHSDLKLRSLRDTKDSINEQYQKTRSYDAMSNHAESKPENPDKEPVDLTSTVLECVFLQQMFILLISLKPGTSRV